MGVDDIRGRNIGRLGPKLTNEHVLFCFLNIQVWEKLLVFHTNLHHMLLSPGIKNRSNCDLSE